MAEAQRLIETGALLADADAEAGLDGAGGVCGGAGGGGDAGMAGAGMNGAGMDGAGMDGAGMDDAGADGATEGADAPPADEQPLSKPVSPLGEVTAQVATYVSEGRIAVEVASMFSRALAEVPDTERT